MFEVVSMALAVVTLAVVASTAWLIRRQVRAADIHNARALQVELVRLGIDRPELLAIFGDFAIDQEKAQLDAYRNLWLKLAEMYYLTGVLSERGIRSTLQQFLTTEDGLEWWFGARAAYEAESHRRDRQKFIAIVEDEWSRARREADHAPVEPGLDPP